MVVWVVRLVVLFVVLTAVYIALSLYNRWAERRRLGAKYEQMQSSGESVSEDRESFVSSGMNAYERSLRRKLVWGVYLIPLGAIALLIFVAQFG